MNDEIHWHTAKEYRSELAADLADLASIRHDLEFVIRATDLALLIPEPTAASLDATLSDDLIRRTSLWNSALVAYARCFGTGVRQRRLSEDLFQPLGGKAEEAVRAHRYCLETRNKYIAHSVNSFERVKVALLVGDGVHSQKGVVGGGPMLVRPAAEKAENVQTLRNLATFLMRHVESVLKEKGSQLLEEARGLPETTLDNLPNLEFPIPVQPDEVAKPRPR